MRLGHGVALVTAVLVLAACTSVPKSPPSSVASSSGGGSSVEPSTKYYKDDGPGDNAPANIESIADAVPRVEPLHRAANRPYTVFGRDYVPATSLRQYRERGIASWYGRKFHGERTSIGETYDMYGMTAAHPTLPLPSYARVTNVSTGKAIIVRVNDRGPFLHNRVIDLSYAAAAKVGILQKGSGEVDVEAILPVESPVIAVAAPLPPVVVAAPTNSATGAPLSDVGPSVPIASTDAGFVVQLGAFANYANAQNFVAHVANQLVPIRVEAKVRQVNGLFRVFVGPYPVRDDARRTAERLRDAFGLASTIAVH